MLHLAMRNVWWVADYASKLDVLNGAVPLPLLQLHIPINSEQPSHDKPHCTTAWHDTLVADSTADRLEPYYGYENIVIRRCWT